MSISVAQKKFSIQELEAVPADAITKIKTFMNKWAMEEMDYETLAKFKYHGFDPRKGWAHTAAILAKYSKAGKSVDEFKQDLFWVISIGVIKGSITEKNFQGLEPEGRTEINRLIDMWQLDLTINKKSSRRLEGITFSRMVQSWPMQSVEIASKVGRTMTGPYESAGLPNIFTTSAFPAIIPTGMDITAPLCCASNAYSSDLSAILQGANVMKMSDESKKEIWTKQYNFTRTGLGSPCHNNDQRYAAMMYFDMKQYFDVIKVVCDANEPGTMVTQQVWDAEFDSIYKVVKGGVRSRAIMPSILQTIINIPGSITEGGAVFPGMAVTDITSIKTYLYWKKEFESFFPDGKAISQDPIPFEKAPTGQDATDLQDEKQFDAETVDYADGFKDMTEDEFIKALEGDYGFCVYVAEEACKDSVLDPSRITEYNGKTGEIREWIDDMEKDKKVYPANKGRYDVLSVLVTNYKSQAMLKMKNDTIRKNRSMLFFSSYERREKVRSYLKGPSP
jgi:hypothetical protein